MTNEEENYQRSFLIVHLQKHLSRTNWGGFTHFLPRHLSRTYRGDLRNTRPREIDKLDLVIKNKNRMKYIHSDVPPWGSLNSIVRDYRLGAGLLLITTINKSKDLAFKTFGLYILCKRSMSRAIQPSFVGLNVYQGNFRTFRRMIASERVSLRSGRYRNRTKLNRRWYEHELMRVFHYYQQWRW